MGVGGDMSSKQICYISHQVDLIQTATILRQKQLCFFHFHPGFQPVALQDGDLTAPCGRIKSTFNIILKMSCKSFLREELQ